MSIFWRATFFAFIIFLACGATPQLGLGAARPDSKMVTRIETATAVMKGGKLVIHADGMATTSARLLPQGGRLVRRGEKFQPNKEGLLEYELQFDPPRNSGDKLREVKAQLTERDVPADIKGVRVFAEFNHLDAMVTSGKKKT